MIKIYDAFIWVHDYKPDLMTRGHNKSDEYRIRYILEEIENAYDWGTETNTGFAAYELLLSLADALNINHEKIETLDEIYNTVESKLKDIENMNINLI